MSNEIEELGDKLCAVCDIAHRCVFSNPMAAMNGCQEAYNNRYIPAVSDKFPKELCDVCEAAGPCARTHPSKLDARCRNTADRNLKKPYSGFIHHAIYAHTYGNEIIKQFCYWDANVDRMFVLSENNIEEQLDCFIPKRPENYHLVYAQGGPYHGSSNWRSATYKYIQSRRISTLRDINTVSNAQQAKVEAKNTVIQASRSKAFMQEMSKMECEDVPFTAQLPADMEAMIEVRSKGKRQALLDKIDVSYLEEALNGRRKDEV